jgi:hypothetical protein
MQGTEPPATDVLLQMRIPHGGELPCRLQIDKLPDGRYPQPPAHWCCAARRTSSNFSATPIVWASAVASARYSRRCNS